MKYYIFRQRFHQPIIDRVKTSTIRPKPKVKPGERFAQRYWSGKPYDSPMGILSTAVCTRIYEVTLSLGIDSCQEPGRPPMIAQLHIHRSIDGSRLTQAELATFARQEGFLSPDDMLAWFLCEHSLPFTGWVTEWDPASVEIANIPD